MGQQPNKYHINDDGKVFRINDNGSFTSVGNIEDIYKKPSSSIDKFVNIQAQAIQVSKY